MVSIVSWLMSFIMMFGIYSQTFVVTDVDYKTDIVQMEDFNGNIWSFKGCEDWLEGDVCSAILWDNDTDIIYDDVILTTRYSGWVE